ncbi:hypothetical protein C8Q80DRAFT_1095010, partial [Daedaleopsis nitida]
NQTEEQSWWPKPSLWQTSGVYTGVWNARNEHWFQKWLNNIRHGCAGLMKT